MLVPTNARISLLSCHFSGEHQEGSVRRSFTRFCAVQIYRSAVQNNSNTIHTWCAKQIPFSRQHVDCVSLEKSKGGRLQSALAYREKQGNERDGDGGTEEGIVCAKELCSQTFDRLALLSSTQPFSIDPTPPPPPPLQLVWAAAPTGGLSAHTPHSTQQQSSA